MADWPLLREMAIAGPNGLNWICAEEFVHPPEGSIAFYLVYNCENHKVAFVHFGPKSWDWDTEPDESAEAIKMMLLGPLPSPPGYDPELPTDLF